MSVTDCPGLNLAGNAPPDTVNPAPVTDAELISSGQVPTDFKVRDFVVAVFNSVLPKAMLVALTLIVDTTAQRPMLYVLDTPAEVAVRTACWAVPTAETLAVNQARDDPAATVTVTGTATAVLLLETPTFTPPVGAAALRAMVHVSFTIPVTDALLHESETNPGVVAACACLVAAVPKSASGHK